MSVFVLAKKVSIRDANAMSAPYIVGFPPMTAWLGGVHAIERNLSKFGVKLPSVAVVVHDFQIRGHKDLRDRRWRFVSSRNPLKQSGDSSSLVEEPKCDLCVSLLIEAKGLDAINQDDVIAFIQNRLAVMRLAGGEVVGFDSVSAVFLDESSDEDERKLIRNLMPGYALISRKDLLDCENDPLDKMIDLISVRRYKTDDGWKMERGRTGWLVPIVVGYRDISGAVAVPGARSKDAEHHFVEPLTTMGEFVMPHRLANISDLLWKYQYVNNKDYLCVNERMM